MKIPWKEILISAIFTVVGGFLGWGISSCQYNEQLKENLKSRRLAEMRTVLKEIDDNLQVGIMDKQVHYGDTSKPALSELNSKAIDNFYLDLPELLLSEDTVLMEKVRSASRAIYKCNRGISRYIVFCVIPVIASETSIEAVWEKRDKNVKLELEFCLHFFEKITVPKLEDLKNYLENNLNRLSNFNL